MKGGEYVELRSMFASIFDRLRGKQGLTRAKLLDGYSNDYVPWNGDAYDNATVRNCIDTIARHASKLHPKHIVRKDGTVVNIPDDSMNYLLGVRPNWLMSSAAFIRMVVAQYYTYNNAFIYIQRDGNGKVLALWPLHYDDLELWEDRENNFYAKFYFGSGESATVPYEDLIHLRRHYNTDYIWGDPDAVTMREDLNLLSATKTAIINAVKNFGRLRGIIKWNGTIRPEDQEKGWKKFVDSYVGQDSNGSGIGTLDNRADFQNIPADYKSFDSSQMDFARDNIYKFFGISKEIVSGKFTEEEYQAFYEAVIEPLAIDMSQEFTEKIFSSRERGFGNEVVFETNRLAYMSTASKVKLAEAMVPAGAIKRNELRELFGYAGLPGPEGEEIVVSLNYVKTKDQSKYQVGNDDNEEPKGGDDDDEK